MLLFCSCNASHEEGNRTATETDTIHTEKNTLNLGITEVFTGDIHFPYFFEDATEIDKRISSLVNGYCLMEQLDDGSYVWNNTVIEKHEEQLQKNGDYIYTITLKPDLTFSDGTKITSKNYLAALLVFSSDVAASIGAVSDLGHPYVGYNSFHAYKGEENPQVFTGIRCLDEYRFAITLSGTDGYGIRYDKEPYMAISPYPCELLLGNEVELKDDGQGCYLTKNWYEKNHTGDYIYGEHLKHARYDLESYPYSGAYQFEQWDVQKKQVSLIKNSKYCGNYEGKIPTIERLVFKRIAEDLLVFNLEVGSIDCVTDITNPSLIDGLLSLQVRKNGYYVNHYKKDDYQTIHFYCDFGPCMDVGVRRAIATMIKQAEVHSVLGGKYAVAVDSVISMSSKYWDEIENRMSKSSEMEIEKLLEQAGWIYNNRGERFSKENGDEIRYRKLKEGEYKEFNFNYRCEPYKTIKIESEYYLPLALIIVGTNSEEMDSLNALLKQTAWDFGMSLQFEALKVSEYVDSYMRNSEGMLANGFYGTSTLNQVFFDYTDMFSSDKKEENTIFHYIDSHDEEYPYFDMNGNHEVISYKNAVRLSENQLGLFYLSYGLAYDVKNENDKIDYLSAFINRYRQLQLEIPLFQRETYYMCSTKLHNLYLHANRELSKALHYATLQ